MKKKKAQAKKKKPDAKVLEVHHAPNNGEAVQVASTANIKVCKDLFFQAVLHADVFACELCRCVIICYWVKLYVFCIAGCACSRASVAQFQT